MAPAPRDGESEVLKDFRPGEGGKEGEGRGRGRGDSLGQWSKGKDNGLSK